jgi:hypothetical protein
LRFVPHLGERILDDEPPLYPVAEELFCQPAALASRLAAERRSPPASGFSLSFAGPINYRQLSELAQ